MAAYRQVYDLQADYQELGSAPKLFVRQLSIGYLYFFTSDYLRYLREKQSVIHFPTHLKMHHTNLWGTKLFLSDWRFALYLHFPYLRFPSLQIRTCLFRTCVFQYLRFQRPLQLICFPQKVDETHCADPVATGNESVPKIIINDTTNLLSPRKRGIMFFTGVGLSVCLFVCLFVCLLPR